MSLVLAALAVLTVQSSTPQADIADVLDRLNVASSTADGPAYFALFTSDARFVGTDPNEHWTMAQFHAFADPYFARGRAWSFPAIDRTITVAPIACRCIAWFEERLDSATYGPTRGSGVLRLTDDGWRIEQYVLSFAIPNDRSDAVVAAVKGDPAP